MKNYHSREVFKYLHKRVNLITLEFDDFKFHCKRIEEVLYKRLEEKGFDCKEYKVMHNIINDKLGKLTF